MCYDWIGPRKANGFVPAQVGARTPSLNPIGNMSRLLLTVGAVIVAVGLAVTALLAQDDLDATRQAAEQGDAEAQYELGGVYLGGRGVVEDEAEAARWLRLAAEQGHVNAQNTLAFMYILGRGVVKDEAEAVRWYRMAAEQGDAWAHFKLAEMYADGRGVVKDEAEAVRWYRLAADQGRTDAPVQPRAHVR